MVGSEVYYVNFDDSVLYFFYGNPSAKIVNITQNYIEVDDASDFKLNNGILTTVDNVNILYSYRIGNRLYSYTISNQNRQLQINEYLIRNENLEPIIYGNDILIDIRLPSVIFSFVATECFDISNLLSLKKYNTSNLIAFFDSFIGNNLKSYSDISNFPQQGLLLIGNEYIQYNGIDTVNNTFLNITRGVYNTNIEQHNRGEVIEYLNNLILNVPLILLDDFNNNKEFLINEIVRNYVNFPSKNISITDELVVTFLNSSYIKKDYFIKSFKNSFSYNINQIPQFIELPLIFEIDLKVDKLTIDKFNINMSEVVNTIYEDLVRFLESKIGTVIELSDVDIIRLIKSKFDFIIDIDVVIKDQNGFIFVNSLLSTYNFKDILNKMTIKLERLNSFPNLYWFDYDNLKITYTVLI